MRREKLKEIRNKRDRDSSRNHRIKNTRSIRRYYLIVCEGTKTEPNYFRSFGRDLPRNLLHIEISGEGKNTLSVVESAIDIRERDASLFDKIWVVFDKNSFSSENYNNAVYLAVKNGFGCACSNEAFELWYLLHFDFFNTAIRRDQYQAKLSKYLGFPYQKNDERMYEMLKQKGNQREAINRAKKLLEKYGNEPPSLQNPSTRVHMLVEELNSYIEHGDKI